MLLTAPAPDFVTRLAMPFFCAVPAALPAVDQGYTPVPMAGPYYIASATPLGEIILKPNSYYGGSRSRHLAEIDVKLDTDPLASMLAIAHGSADYDIGNLDTTLLRSYEAKGKLGTAQFSVHPDLELRYLIFNPEAAGLPRRRGPCQAVNLALDRRHILAVSGLYGKPSGQILPPRDARLPQGRDLPARFVRISPQPGAWSPGDILSRTSTSFPTRSRS